MLIAVSGRGAAPAGHKSPTSYLARSLAEVLGHPELPIVRATQVHGTNARLIEDHLRPGEVLDVGEADILITQQKSIALVVQTADCLPILIAGDGVIAAVHAGWKGSALDAAGTAVRKLETSGVPATSLRVWIGSSIGPCCFEVREDVAQFFSENVKSREAGRIHLDLRKVNQEQLAKAGVAPHNISFNWTCTRCGGEKYASYRRDGNSAGRMIALIARLP